jgi:tetratricopeptide (TPR) repeat protein
MSKGKLFSGLLFVLTLVTAAPAQPARAVPAGSGAASPEKAVPFEQKKFDEMRAAGFGALYNLDYEGARRQFREMTRVFPEHPAGYQFLAAGLWLKTLNESRRLQTSLYNNEGFYKEKDDKADPKVVAEFRELTTRAKTLCEERLKRDPKDVEALYYLGAVEGLKAAFAGAVERSFMSALRSGRESVDKHRDVIKLDPTFHDAKVTIGMYDYVVGTLPLPVKIGATFLGVRGSKKKGLAALEQVAREGTWARDDAALLLMALLKRERRFADAYAYAAALAERYPRNYIFKMEAADALVARAASERATDPAAARKSEEAAFAIFDSLLAPPRAPQRGELPPPKPPLDLVHLSYGEALFVAGLHERAYKEFDAAARMTGAEASVVTRAQLRSAQVLDLAGRREEAVVQYKAVLARPNVYDSHEEARRGLKEPYRVSGKVAEAAGGEDETDGAGGRTAN